MREQKSNNQSAPQTRNSPETNKPSVNSSVNAPMLVRALSQPSKSTLTPAVMRAIQSRYGNQYAARLVNNMINAPSIQRGVWAENGANAVTVTSPAKTRATAIVGKGLHNGGAVADGTKIGGTLFQSLDSFANGKGWTHSSGAGASTFVYEGYKDKYFCGGRVFNNSAAASRLPTSDTYTEWDVNQLTITGTTIGARDGERIVIGAGGKKYYSNDHYANFTEFK